MRMRMMMTMSMMINALFKLEIKSTSIIIMLVLTRCPVRNYITEHSVLKCETTNRNTIINKQITYLLGIIAQFIIEMQVL